MTNNLSRREREKLAREAEIISAAEKIFIRKGFEEASMDEIAKEAQFTRRTIYQYFTGKEDLYFAVVLKAFKQLLSYLQASMVKASSGFEKIRRAGLAYYQFYKDFPEIFRLLNYIGFIKKRSANSLKFKEFMKVNDRLFQEIAEVIEEGKADGSIRNDIEKTKGAYSLAFILTGFFYQLSISSKTFTEHFTLDEEGFIQSSLDLIYQAIRV